MLSPYRVLDLTDERGLFCGKLLGDLGADVIKIEKPGGDSARNIGPFYHDQPDPEKSLLWFAFNTSKRGITLDIEKADGQEIFKRLVKKSDFVIESFPPGYMDRLGLGYAALEQINPGIIMVSITPFGQTGPYRDYKAPDIVAWAMGGQTYPCGDSDRPPIRVSHHSQSDVLTAVSAADGALMALYYRGMTGEGQHVDVSIQASLASATHMVTSTWDMQKINMRRGGIRADMNVRITRIWPCRDGYVLWNLSGGAEAKRFNLPTAKWMDGEGMAGDFLRGFDWDTFDWQTTTQDTVDRLEEPAGRFFMSHTKAELLEGAVRHRVVLYPVYTTRDILENGQLAAREYWVEVEHPELGTSITYPGAFARSTELSPRISRRAPLIGEHNEEVYGELGFSREELLMLKEAGVI